MVSNIDNTRFTNATSWKIKCPGQDGINDQRRAKHLKMENNNKSDRCYNIYKLNYYTNYTH